MHILSLRAENIKRLSAIELTPDTNDPLFIIGGPNGAGKSSAMDSVEYALGGASRIPAQPIRLGQTQAKIGVDLGTAGTPPQYIVTRTFTADGRSAVRVTNADGATYSSPQALLDKIYGDLTFDPCAFERMSPADQASTLRRLAHLSFEDLDARESAAMAQRAEVNRETKKLEAQLAAQPDFPDASPAEVSIVTLMVELNAAEATAEAARTAANDVVQAKRRAADAHAVCETHHRRLDALREEYARVERDLQQATTIEESCDRLVTSFEQALEQQQLAVIDRAPIAARIANTDTINRQVRAHHAYTTLAAALEASRASATTLTHDIDTIRLERKQRLQQTVFPVPGLSMTLEGAVTFGGLPLDQASTAERLRISVAIGLALNPTLKVLLIRDGSALDQNSLRLIAEQAASADAQIWLEKVSDSAEGVTVLIEDGAVVATAPPAARRPRAKRQPEGV